MESPSQIGLTLFLLWVCALTGCSRSENPESTSESTSPETALILQLDWVPEAAHGGFYAAVVNGYYAEEGIEVEIRSGGPGVNALQNVLLGKVDLTLGRLDEVIQSIDRSLPLAVAMSYHQHDPQGIMVHAEDPIQTFADFDGRKLMTAPGGPIPLWLEHEFNIKLQVIPLDYGTQRFAMDKTMTQQCFVTSQPFYLKKEGVATRTFLLADGGFDPGRIVFGTKNLIEKNPELIEKFIRASLRGWVSYLYGDNELTNKKILELNSSVTPELNAYSVEQMRDLYILAGRPELNLIPGTLPPERVDQVMTIMKDIGLIDKTYSAEEIVPYGSLPEYIRDPEAAPEFLELHP